LSCELACRDAKRSIERAPYWCTVALHMCNAA